ncbi:MAG: anhydro-N-acetylmuramic acid kinase [Pigmentiphaga sp.]|uniref:anhydro-N-acetylmuramic acid kinase n=1 Tax=Pigmentiphaga sp. TaxID=1977564 RepID=UPI0029B0D54A|nr:anhydro-N-acetylmuramic acid kinase [Pigmentiphaga sp.]MDX3904839.1 anhydro-N-acetylmuramic acid kinase [Pigmentiphaga sp.]
MAGTGRYIGLMSGTSLDGVDGVAAEFSGDTPRILAHADLPLPADLRAELLALNTPGHDEIGRMSRAAQALADLYAEVVGRLLSHTGLTAADFRAIGAHGQTVRHRPDLGYTVQLNAPARLAERTGIAVVADLRSRDIAAGGQGAPLVPAFHAAVFGTDRPQAVVNLGGIANITLLSPSGVIGYDTGPANLLLDLWCHRHTGRSYDEDGRYAASGQVQDALLSELIASEPWLAEPPPKSTGRDLFNAPWLDRRLADWETRHGPVGAADVQATLLALTAETVAREIRRQMPDCQAAWICGGGARNPVLMSALGAALPCPVAPTDQAGIPAQQMEALAFAWLAHRHVQGEAGNLPAVTGAAGPRILGAYYPGQVR